MLCILHSGIPTASPPRSPASATRQGLAGRANRIHPIIATTADPGRFSERGHEGAKGSDAPLPGGRHRVFCAPHGPAVMAPSPALYPVAVPTGLAAPTAPKPR